MVRLHVVNLINVHKTLILLEVSKGAKIRGGLDLEILEYTEYARTAI